MLISWFCESFGGDARFKLFIIGEGPEHQKLEGLVRQYHAAEQVRLLGRIEHAALPPYYHACDAFATASLSEMNSISMLEAMASGLYVLQRLDLYNKDQITPGVSGGLPRTGGPFCGAESRKACRRGGRKPKVWQRRICAPRVGRIPARRSRIQRKITLESSENEEGK